MTKIRDLYGAPKGAPLHPPANRKINWPKGEEGYGLVSGTVIARNMYGNASETIMATTMSAPPSNCLGVIVSFSQNTLRKAANTGSRLNSTADSVGPSRVWAAACPQNANTVENRARYSVAPTTGQWDSAVTAV